MPYVRKPESVLCGSAALKPETLAVMHGSFYIGYVEPVLTDLARVIKENFD